MQKALHGERSSASTSQLEASGTRGMIIVMQEPTDTNIPGNTELRTTFSDEMKEEIIVHLFFSGTSPLVPRHNHTSKE